MAERQEVTVVGGGVAGLVASVVCAEGGARVRLLEAHETLGGRGRSSAAPYVANFGPHVLYANGALWGFLRDRDLLPPMSRPALGPIRFRARGRLRRTPPAAMTRAIVRLWRVREAPDEIAFRDWATARVGADGAEWLGRSAGVFSFHHDPGALSAAFVWDRWRQAFCDLPPKARYATGGWGAIVAALERGAHERGVTIETGARVRELPQGAVIVATELRDAVTLLGDETIGWSGGATVALDLGLRSDRRDPFVVWDLDEAGWIERFSACDRTLAPRGEELVQAQLPLWPGEPVEACERRLEALLDCGLGDGWRGRVTFRRRMLLDDRSGAVDHPGTSWRDRPAVVRGAGRFLAGDAVAAPGLLSDPAVISAVEAARGALAWRSGDARWHDGARRATVGGR
jgi:glycine/D-amino acid oxidase-like deaminating enzyme